jgi:hypothetical protein
MRQKENFKHPTTLRFHCTKCGLCCGNTKERQRHILLLPKEAQEIAAVTSKPISVFANIIDGKEPYTYEMKKTKENSACFFLADNLCSIYSFRPLICRFYPFELGKGESKEPQFSFTRECPGIEKGRILGAKYFKKLFTLAQTRLMQD